MIFIMNLGCLYYQTLNFSIWKGNDEHESVENHASLLGKDLVNHSV